LLRPRPSKGPASPRQATQQTIGAALEAAVVAVPPAGGGCTPASDFGKIAVFTTAAAPARARVAAAGQPNWRGALVSVRRAA